jgi:hypothetical protein
VRHPTASTPGPTRPDPHQLRPHTPQHPSHRPAPGRQSMPAPRTPKITSDKPPLDRTRIGLYREHSASKRDHGPPGTRPRDHREGLCISVVGTVPPQTTGHNLAHPGAPPSALTTPLYPPLVGTLRDAEQARPHRRPAGHQTLPEVRHRQAARGLLHAPRRTALELLPPLHSQRH